MGIVHIFTYAYIIYKYLNTLIYTYIYIMHIASGVWLRALDLVQGVALVCLEFMPMLKQGYLAKP